MSRSTKKGPYVDDRLYRRTVAMEGASKKEPMKTWARDCTIIPEFVNHTYMVHNGRAHVRVYVTEDMVGHKLGEFAPTRTYYGHGKDKKK